MIRIYSSENRLEVQQIKDLLESKQIDCFIKNEFAIGAVGELSPFDAWPEVWLVDAEWEAKANAFITVFLEELKAQQVKGDWECERCHETNESTFEICWSCGMEAQVEA